MAAGAINEQPATGNVVASANQSKFRTLQQVQRLEGEEPRKVNELVSALAHSELTGSPMLWQLPLLVGCCL
jgi:hypothetical protein